MNKNIRDTSFLTKNLIAHRGYHNIKEGIPENSISAFEKAIKYNLIIELDVHILKDGTVVVFHDNNLKRMTGINQEIKNITYKELQKLRLQDTNQKIPSLQEVLELVNGKVPIIIELKYDVKCGLLEKEVIKILKNYSGLYAIKSFNPFSVYYFRKHFKEAIRGQLISDTKNIKKKFQNLLSKILIPIITKPDFISYDIRTLPNHKINKLRKHKLILGWTVRTEEDLENAKKYCDNVICENINLKNNSIQ